jgi:uncharacterized protein (DUF952 family)
MGSSTARRRTRSPTSPTAASPGRTDLVLLTIEPPLLDAPVVWEDLEGEGEDYPHVYGPIPRSAVIAARPYRPGADGSFPRPL